MLSRRETENYTNKNAKTMQLLGRKMAEKL